jgi:hypothetical protein
MLYEVQSELIQDYGVSINLKRRVSQNPFGKQCDKYNQGLNRNMQIFCIGCAMLDSFKLLNDLCNECWASDFQARQF